MNAFGNRSRKVPANSSRHARNVTVLERLDVLLGHHLDMKSQSAISVNPSTAQRFDTKSVGLVSSKDQSVNTVSLFRCLMSFQHQWRFAFVRNIN